MRTDPNVLEIINLTSHDINVVLTDKDDIGFNNGSSFRTFHPSGIVARVETEYETKERLTIDNNHRESFCSVNIRERYFNEIQHLPLVQENTRFIVSKQVAEACANKRDDLLFVDTPLRTTDGRIYGCEALARWPKQKEMECGDGSQNPCKSCGGHPCVRCGSPHPMEGDA